MLKKCLVPAAAIAAIVGFGSAAAADNAESPIFSALAGVKAKPMTTEELKAVKGTHVHFLDPNGGFHLAGNPENPGVGEGNWYNNGSPEAESGHLVAPSYHGLCVAAGTPSGIVIPPFGPSGPTLPQCP